MHFICGHSYHEDCLGDRDENDMFVCSRCFDDEEDNENIWILD